jgi:hypothetical protein
MLLNNLYKQIFLGVYFTGMLSGIGHAADKITFWDTPKYGGNSFNRLPPDNAYFKALHAYGASWVRLSYDKWQPAQRDFLLGNADHYQGLDAQDLTTLIETLDRAQVIGLKVVITPLSLPGMRWSQNNGGNFDDRLWTDKVYWEQSAAFWHDLAKVLKSHKAVAAYNLINEPAPEKMGALAEHSSLFNMRSWYEQNKGSSRDLPAFYQMLIRAIRKVDPLTPIMVDGGWYGAADGFSYWPEALPDQRVLYSFHMYEPYDFTSAPNIKRAKPYQYPGVVPFGQSEEMWNAQRVNTYMQQPFDWAKKNRIPANRMVAGEFGCIRTLPGCRQYLEDVLKVMDDKQAHWAFYSFREDSWDLMDYELGKSKVPWSYWQAIDLKIRDTLQRNNGPEFEPISLRLRKNKTVLTQPTQ